MQFSEEVKATLWSLIDEMTLDLGSFTVNPDTDFKRKRKWDFQTLIKFIISMESQSLKNELHKYFGYTTDCPTNRNVSYPGKVSAPFLYEIIVSESSSSGERTVGGQFCKRKEPWLGLFRIFIFSITTFDKDHNVRYGAVKSFAKKIDGFGSYIFIIL